MRKEVREALVNGLKGKKIAKIDGEKSGQFCLVVKNYQTPTGISYNLHNANSRDIFNVKGPLGKSLCLEKNGDHVAFLAGTGLLVFLDLVALIAKFHLGLLN